MINEQRTRSGNVDLNAISLGAVQAVLRAVERMTDDRPLQGLVESMRAGDGAGLLAADAMSTAVRRLGAWTVVETLQSFLMGLARGTPATPSMLWALSGIAAMRAGQQGIEAADERAAEDARCAFQEEVGVRLGEASNWLEGALLHLCEFATWAAWTERSDAYRAEDTIERAADDAGLEIAAVLAAECGASAAWEFVLRLRTIAEPTACVA